MKVLIVNGFSNTQTGEKSFNQFVACVKEAFSLQHFYSVVNIEFETVDLYSLDMYLSELNTGYLNRDSEKVRDIQLFDHLDFVFVDGDANILPWFERARKFLILVRMCKKTKKLLFACSFAMQMVVFLCATNLYITRVVNGNGKGSPKVDFARIEKKTLKELVFGEVFIDSTTGDVYGYDSQKCEFYPIANVGIHNHKAAQENGPF